MIIMLGNLTLKQIEERTGINISDEDRAELNGMRQEKAENIAPGKWHCFEWHCFDLPFCLCAEISQLREKWSRFCLLMIGRKQKRRYRFRGRGEQNV